MKKRIAILPVVGLLMLVFASEAAAETLYATAQTPLYDRPGEMARIVTRVAPGTKLIVLRKPKGDSRWYKVRANGRTGWIQRTKVTAKMVPQGRKAKTRRSSRREAFVEGRGRKRGSSGRDAPRDRVAEDAITEDEDVEEVIDEDGEDERRPRRRRARRAERDDEDFEDDEEEDFEEEEEREPEEEDDGALRVSGDTVMFARPSRRSKEVADLDSGDSVWVVKESSSGRWVKVETADGESGWVRSKYIGAASYARPKYAIDAMAGLGVTFLSQTFASNGPEGNDISAYKLNASTINVGIGSAITYDYSSSLLLGGDFGYRYGRATPGIRYNDGITAVDIPFTTHTVEVGGRVGYKLTQASGMALYGRAGYYYQHVSIDNFNDVEKNPLFLPNENVGAFVVGARFEAPRVLDYLALVIGFDYFLPSQREQTRMLDDGQTADVSAYVGKLRVLYRWKPKWNFVGSYDYAKFKTEFQGMATRPTDATAAERSDLMHSVNVGLVRDF